MYKYNKYLYLAEEANNKMKYLKIFGGIVLVIVVVLVIKHFVGGSESESESESDTEYYNEYNYADPTIGFDMKGGEASSPQEVISTTKNVDDCKDDCDDAGEKCGGFVHYEEDNKTYCNFKTISALNTAAMIPAISEKSPKSIYIKEIAPTINETTSSDGGRGALDAMFGGGGAVHRPGRVLNEWEKGRDRPGWRGGPKPERRGGPKPETY